MTWSYNPDTMDDKDRIRRLIGDKLSDFPQLEDEEIYDTLALEGNKNPHAQASSLRVLYRAAAKCAGELAGLYSRRVTVQTGGDQKKFLSDLAKQYGALERSLHHRASHAGIGPRTGGLSLSDKYSSQLDTDLEQPFFRRSMQTEPGTGPDSPLSGDQEELEFGP